MLLNGKRAIVTGAGGGIGAEIAVRLSELGADIAIIDVCDEKRASETMDKIRSNGTRALFYRCNIVSPEECKSTVKRITEDLGGVEILVNNAGITRDNLIMTMEESEFDAVLDTNLKGAFNMIKAVGRCFIKNKYGKVINIASVSGLLGTAGQANYAASKAGLIALTKVCAREFAAKGVCCNAIAPGFIKTPMTSELDSEAFLSKIPKGRLGEPRDVANLAAFLASDLSDYVTGEVIRVDGGLAM